MAPPASLEDLETALAELVFRIGADALDRQRSREDLLRRLVDQPSGSGNRPGIARVLDLLAPELEALGLEVTRHEDEEGPRHIGAATPGSAGAQRRLLLVGHCDTVFPSTDRRRLTLDDARFYGPGCTDMKGGLVVALDALQDALPLLRERGVAVEVIFNGDEELGSPHSRPLIEARARGAEAALVFENCPSEDALIVGRLGLGRARVEVTGRAAHAGINPDEGASAILEAAHQIVEASGLDAPDGGVRLNVGLARGGISRNTIPPHASFDVDLRWTDEAAARAALAQLASRTGRSAIAGTSSRFTGELHRPPMDAEAAGQRWMLQVAATAGRACGLPVIRGLESGGGSDANLTAALAIPSIDGLGVVGGDIHTRSEWGLRRSLGTRSRLTATLLAAIALHPPSGAAREAPRPPSAGGGDAGPV